MLGSKLMQELKLNFQCGWLSPCSLAAATASARRERRRTMDWRSGRRQRWIGSDDTKVVWYACLH